MANSGKGILLAIVVLAVAGIAYLTLSDRVGPDEGAEGTIGVTDQHQAEKTRYYEDLNKLKDLSTDKIQALGTISAKFESAPTEAQKMLEQHGWSKKEFDKMVEAVRTDDELNKVFEAGRKLASQP